MEDYTKLYHLLFNAITDALEQMNAQNFGSAKETLVSAQQKADRKNYIIVKSNIGVRKILLSQLVYVEAQDRRVIYHLQNGGQVDCIARFSAIAGELLKNIEFIQPHRSYLVNMSYINIIGTMDMELQDHTVLPLAQRRVTEIKEHYLAYQMGEIMP